MSKKDNTCDICDAVLKDGEIDLCFVCYNAHFNKIKKVQNLFKNIDLK